MAEKAKDSKPAAERAVRFAEKEVWICEGDEALTAEKAKELLDWQEEGDGKDGVKFGDNYLFQLPKDLGGKKVRCLNNDHNRPFNEGWARTLAQDILNRHWRFNGETIIISKYGRISSGQHRLVALVLAELERTNPKKAAHWKALWPDSGVRLETLLAVGFSEDKETTRTLDNVRPRTLEDVLFTEDVFAKSSPADRRIQCRILSYAVRMLWLRAGADENSYAPKRTHSESLDFITRHPRVIAAAKHIWEEMKAGQKKKGGPKKKADKDKTEAAKQNGDGENKEKKVGLTGLAALRIPPGDLAGLLYLMGASASDGDTYWLAGKDGSQNEEMLNFENWDHAEEFFVLLASKAPDVAAISEAIGRLADPDDPANGGSRNERIAILVKGWNRFIGMPNGEKIEREDVSIKDCYKEDDDGIQHFAKMPCVVGADGETGIDLGDNAQEESEGDAVSPQAYRPSPEEIERGKKEARERKIAEVIANRARRKAEAQAKKAADAAKELDAINQAIAEGRPVPQPEKPAKAPKAKPKTEGAAPPEATAVEVGDNSEPEAESQVEAPAEAPAEVQAEAEPEPSQSSAQQELQAAEAEMAPPRKAPTPKKKGTKGVPAELPQ